jgi:hypothetical protein
MDHRRMRVRFETREEFLSSQKLYSGAYLESIYCVARLHSTEVNLQQREAAHSPPSNKTVKLSL